MLRGGAPHGRQRRARTRVARGSPVSARSVRFRSTKPVRMRRWRAGRRPSSVSRVFRRNRSVEERDGLLAQRVGASRATWAALSRRMRSAAARAGSCARQRRWMYTPLCCQATARARPRALRGPPRAASTTTTNYSPANPPVEIHHQLIACVSNATNTADVEMRARCCSRDPSAWAAASGTCSAPRRAACCAARNPRRRRTARTSSARGPCINEACAAAAARATSGGRPLRSKARSWPDRRTPLVSAGAWAHDIARAPEPGCVLLAAGARAGRRPRAAATTRRR